MTPNGLEGVTMRMTDISIRKLGPKAPRYEAWEGGRTGPGFPHQLGSAESLNFPPFPIQ